MSKYFFYILMILSLNNSIYSQEEINEPVPVDFVNLNRYTGLWYEVAKIPNSFQDHCEANAKAFYKLLEDGTIEVINSCKEKDGSTDTAEGIAQVVDTVSNSKLEVSFVRIFGINLFWGDYWILGLGNDYEYALVGTPSRKYGWILCRNKEMSAEQLDKAFSIFEMQGYDKFEFVKTVQE